MFGALQRLKAGGGAAPPAAPTLTAPDDDDVLMLGSGYTVSATTTDGDLDEMQWVLDPGTMDETVVATDATDDGLGGYSTTWTVDLDTDLLGAHTLVARAVRGGLETDSAPIDIVIDEWLLSWVDPSAVLQYCRADLGVTESSGRVSAWADQSGNGNHYAQATGAQQFEHLATGGPNSTPALRCDTIDRRMVASGLNLPAPGTTPTLIWGVLRFDSWVDARYIMTGGGANHMNIWQRTTSNTVKQFNTGHANEAAITVSAWGRMIAYFSNSTSDRCKFAASNATGQNAGNTDPSAGRWLGNITTNSSALFTISELAHMNRAYVSTEESDVDAYITRRYGSGLT